MEKEKIIVSLLYAVEKIHTGFETPNRGLRYGDLGSCLNTSIAEGLSPDVTLFLFPKIKYVSVSFSNVLLRLISSDDNQCLDGDNIQDDKLLTAGREIGYSERLGLRVQYRRSKDNQELLKDDLELITAGVGIFE